MSDDRIDRPFTVQSARSGATYLVPAGQTIVARLAEDNVYLDTSCEQGVCGTCILAVVAGVPDHRDEVLSDEDKAGGALMVPCVSRALTDTIVLDF